VAGAVIAQGPTGPAHPDGLGERKQLDTMAVDQVIISHGGPLLQALNTQRMGRRCYLWRVFPRCLEILKAVQPRLPQHEMRRVLRVIAPVVALSLNACGPAAQSVKPVPPSHAASSLASPTAEPDSSPTATPASVPSINDAVSLAAELAGVEQAIRIPDTAT